MKSDATLESASNQKRSLSNEPYPAMLSKKYNETVSTNFGQLSDKKIIQQSREKDWVKNFHMMFSKDNPKYPKMMRELFEKPLLYDINGAVHQVPHPYGWDIFEEHDPLVKQKYKCFSPKIANINTIAFSNFMSASSISRQSKNMMLLPLSPTVGNLMKGKTNQFYKDHLVVRN